MSAVKIVIKLIALTFGICRLKDRMKFCMLNCLWKLQLVEPNMLPKRKQKFKKKWLIIIMAIILAIKNLISIFLRYQIF